MRCRSCRGFCFGTVCSACRHLHLHPEPKVRRLACGLEVLSLYPYRDIEPFLLTKHHPGGWRLYRLLAKEAFGALRMRGEKLTAAVPVDDSCKSGYSHTAILAKALESCGYLPLFNVLRAQNSLSYSGQPLSFRLENPRDFIYSGPRGIEAVVVDDIVTTGLTLQEAKQTLARHGVGVKRAIVLADADR